MDRDHRGLIDMHMPVRTAFAFSLLCVGPLRCVRAASAVRPYPDPGYARLGIYGGGHPRYTDYSFGKIGVGDELPIKKKWWANVREIRERGDGAHDIWTFSWGKGAATLEQARQRVCQSVGAENPRQVTCDGGHS